MPLVAVVDAWEATEGANHAMTNDFDPSILDSLIQEIISVLRDNWGVATALDEETAVNLDLGFAGEEAEALMVDLAAKYQIDLDSFRFSDYFYREEEIVSPGHLLRRVLRIGRPRSLRPLRIIDLARASHGGGGGHRL
jgi:hypothetical protein